VYENGANQIAIVGLPGGIPVTNWETGQQYNLVSKNLASTGNTISGTLPNLFSDSLGGADWTTFVTTLNSNNNTYYAGSNSNAGAFVIPTPAAGTMVDFSIWKTTRI